MLFLTTSTQYYNKSTQSAVRPNTMTPTPPIETTTANMMDNPPVHHNEGLFAANHGIIQKPPAIDTFNTASLSRNGFDAIWQYSSITE
jgi:hypothetical protein